MNIRNSRQINTQNTTSVFSKPKLRGKIHCAAFMLTCFGFLLFLLSSYFYQFNLGILIYLISQLLQFGVSSFYHIPDWNPKTKLLLRYLDHSCIFLLISGTQTSVLLNNIPKTELRFALLAIKLSWGITLIGISRFFIVSKLYDIFDLICYICHGLVILPFVKLISYFDAFELAFVCLGGLFYIVGGIVYGLERPNPIPELIGYHEIFHIFTLLANTCFAIVITKDYIYSVILGKIK